MATFAPGTPEYQAEYDKEMLRLEAEAAASPDKPEELKADETPSNADAAEVADKTKAATTDLPPEVKKQIETLEKRVSETQRWGHQNAAEVARLKREADTRKHAETRPAILDANPGLEDAIKHVAAPTTQETPEQRWLSAVTHAIPDAESLLADPNFFAKAKEKQSALGPEWDNPLTAIRELSELKAEHISSRNARAAVESARKDFEAKAKKRNAMDMPGGSGGKDSEQRQTDEAQKVWDMPAEKFNAMRAKTLGY